MYIQSEKPFCFKYTRPSSDWFDWSKAEIKPDEYSYFRLELRDGPSWWLIGMNLANEEWETYEIGELYDHEITPFINWATIYHIDQATHELSRCGNRILEVKMISSDFNIFDEIMKIMPKDVE